MHSCVTCPHVHLQPQHQQHHAFANKPCTCNSGQSLDNFEDALPLGRRLTVIGELIDTGRVRENRKSHLHGSGPAVAIRKPRDGGPFMVSKEAFEDIVAGHKRDASSMMECSKFFGVAALTFFGLRIATFAWDKFQDHRARYNLLCSTLDLVRLCHTDVLSHVPVCDILTLMPGPHISWPAI